MDFNSVFGNGASIVWLFVLILSVAVAGKFIGTVIPARLLGLKKNESLAIGSMMMGKGAMELVFAQVALEANLIGKDLFSILVLVAFISTALAPIMFKHYYNKAIEEKEISPIRLVMTHELNHDLGP